MKVLILGIPYFAKKLQQQLSKFDKNNVYIHLDTYSNNFDKFRYIFHILKADIIYMHGGSICCSGVIDLALRLNIRIILNWAGTDVLIAKELFIKKKYNSLYINNIEHYCVSPWLKEELKEIGITSKVLNITVVNKNIGISRKLPKKLTVLSYISNDRPEFYGMKTILRLANDFSNIDFRLAGLSEYENIPKNIKLLGWVNMSDEYINNTVFIRAAEHDGMPFSVIEALSFGMIVFFNKKYPHTNYFKCYNDLKLQLSRIIDDCNNGKLTINQASINFVETEFSQENTLYNLVRIFNKNIGTR
jgi:virulence-associated protein VapD